MVVTSPHPIPRRVLLECLATEVAVGRLRLPLPRSLAHAEVPEGFAGCSASTIVKLAVTID